MGDVGEAFRAANDYKRELRKRYGVPCPYCKAKRPKACATILLPGQRCFDGYRDTRRPLTDEQRDLGPLGKWTGVNEPCRN